MRKMLIFLFITGLLALLAVVRPISAEEQEEKKPRDAAELGEMLFFEKAFSADKTISCASCHIPAFAFADTLAFSVGVGGKKGRRNAPSCMNLAGRPHFFYDGRAATLEDQVHFPVEDPAEMAFNLDTAVARLEADSGYREYFRNIFGRQPDREGVTAAIAAFEKTLETANTPFDDYMDGDSTAISAAAIRGRELFMSKRAKCFDCHFSPDFTGDEFRNIGLFDGKQLNDSGRYEQTRRPEDIGKFKVPGLRNVAVTAPYMHNGMFRTLREVINYYDNPYRIVRHPVNIDSLLLLPLHLTRREKNDLEAFLHTLTDRRFTVASKTAKP